MSYMSKYLDVVNNIIEKIKKEEEKYQELAVKIVDCFEKDGLIFTFGSGHGHLLALEAFSRAGGLRRVCPILDERLMLHVSARASSTFEKTENNAFEVFNEYDVNENDVVMIFSNSGLNALIIETALLAKERGALTIAVVNLAHCQALPARHSNGLKLYEICDYVLDTFGELGDAAVDTSYNIAIGPTSTIAGSLIIHSLNACITTEAEKRNFPLELLRSGNLPLDEENEKRKVMYFEKFKKRIKAL